jgi:ABC-type branched-subunit amino acid transport system substrate-binding protein
MSTPFLSKFRGSNRAPALAVGFVLVLTACGQKPGVHVQSADSLAAGAAQSAGPASSVGSPDTDDILTLPDSPSADVANPGSQPAMSGNTPTSDTTSPGTTTSQDNSAPGSTQAAPVVAGSRTPRGSDRTGLTADTIFLGAHAPVTGAAPLPVTSFEKSSDLYWRDVIDGGQSILGRTKVEMTFRDDRYDPSAARQVCRELEAEVFTFTGGGGTDQIQACGAFAQQAEVPYFSVGVTEAGLRGNPWYFASSMSYAQQGPLLAQFVKTHPDTKGKRVGAIITDTPNFDDAIAGWEAGVKASGLDYYKTLKHPKGDTSWYNSYLSDFADNGVEVVFILSSPVDYIRFAQQARQSGVTFQFVGVGISMGLNAVLGSGCGNDDVDNGIFFSPFPGIDWARKNLPEFFEAGERYGVPTDDIALALWGANAVLHELFKEYEAIFGNDLTREDFRDVVENSSLETDVFPSLAFAPENHFGASTVHVLQADCATKEYHTLATFAAAF